MKRRSIITIAMVLCCCMLFHVSAIATQTITQDIVSWQDKIDPSVYESPVYENGKRLVLVKRTNISDIVIEQKVKQQYGYDVSLYENEILYNSNIVPAITEQVVSTIGETQAYSTLQNELNLNESISPIDIALSNDYNEYILAKRSVVSSVYTEDHLKFIEKNGNV